MKKTLLLIYSLFTFSLTLSAQSFTWAKREGDQTEGNIVCSDNAGNTYVYGRFYAAATIAGQMLNVTNGDHFIAKYDPMGNPLWVRQLNSMEASELVCTSSDVYLSGRFGAGATFNGSPVGNGSGWDGYVAKVSASGGLSWFTSITNPSTYESANSVDVDNSGNVYATGNFNGSSATVGTTTLTSTGGASMFLLKLDPAGSVTWARSFSAIAGGSVSGDMIKVASSGELYVKTTAEGDTATYDTFTYFAGSYPAELLLHLSNTGGFMHYAELNHISQDNITSMTLDAGGNVYTLQTNYLISFTLSKFNSSLGTTWSVTDGTGGHLSVRSVQVTQSGQVMVAGDVGEDATFGGSHVVHDHYGSNGFIATYSGSGAYSSVKVIPGNIFMGSASLDGADNLYLTGAMSDSASFDAINLTSNNVATMFLARYGTATGIESYQEDNFSVYPNPSSGMLTCELKSSEATTVQLYNTIGEKIYEEKITTDKIQVDLSGFKKGIYLMSIGNRTSLSSRKIVVN
jgi:hypothetical protein